MFINVNNEKIEIKFDPYIYVNVWGPEYFYYVELREYVKDNPESRFVEGFHFNRNANIVKDYNFYFLQQLVVLRFYQIFE